MNGGSISSISEDDDDTSFSALIGVKVNDYFAAELEYIDFGNTNMKATSSGEESWNAGPIKTDLDADGWLLAGVASYPITDHFSVFARLGMLWCDTTEKFTETGLISKENNSGRDAYYGGGIKYQTGPWQLRGEIARTEIDDDGYDIDRIGLTLIWGY